MNLTNLHMYLDMVASIFIILHYAKGPFKLMWGWMRKFSNW